MISSALPYPQSDGALALVPIAAALLGIVVASRGIPRAVLSGLTIGYLAFGLVFTLHISSHSYYSLPLIAIFSLAIGTLAGFLLERLPVATRNVLIGLIVLIIGGTIYKDARVLTEENPHQAIADYRRIGELTGHTTRALVIDQRLISPISYWGWMVGRYWYEPSAGLDLGPASDRAPLRVPGHFDFLIVMQVSELRTEPRLRAFTRRLPVVARTSRYAVFDLRGGRTLAAGRPAAPRWRAS
jgi:hypothetical protein